METDQVCKAFVAAQAAFKAAVKDATNPHFRSQYADLSSVIDAVRPALSANNLAFIQPVEDSGAHFVISTKLIHSSGQMLSMGTMRVPMAAADMCNPQKVGAAITYSRRYHLASAMGLSQEDDDGNSVSLPKPTDSRPAPAQAPPRPAQRMTPGPSAGPANAAPVMPPRPTDMHASPKQLAYLKTLVERAGMPMPVIKTAHDASQAIDMLTKRLAPQRASAQYGDDSPPHGDRHSPAFTTQEVPF